MKVRISVLGFLILFVWLMFSQCGSGNPNRQHHDFAASKDFKRLSREEQVKKCGSCHQEIYENEMLGPHSHAYANLKAHIDFVNGKSYDCPEYKTIINNYSVACFMCHTSKNIYESVFAMDEGDYNFSQTLMGKKKKIEMRDATEATTGVDCITCHFDGEGVITGANFKPSANTTNCPGYCNPVASKFFSSNANCQPCHAEQYSNVRQFNMKNHVELACRSCHEEKDMAEKYTHYTYWAHNPAGKTQPENLNLFNSIEAAYVPDKQAVKIVWHNKYLPHKVSVCTELIAFIEITADGKTVKYDTIRLNRRPVHIKQGSAMGLNDKTFPGIDGYEFKGLNDSLVKMIPVSGPAANGNYNISITGIKKEQYWLNDSINTVYYRKNYQL